MTVAPVVIIGFNRPDLIQLRVSRVLEAEPAEVYLLADGPRPESPGDVERCAAVREAFDRAPWPGSVHRRYVEQNLGCGPAVASGLDWVFERVDRAIILEDDCLADPSFFPWCDELLERHADDDRVMQVSGTNLLADEACYGSYSYGFNTFAPVWGWATWRRAWRHYDRLMQGWPAFRDAGMVEAIPGSSNLRRLYVHDWDRTHRGDGTWDHQWQYTVLSQHGLAASPSKNLVTNLGFRDDATRTTLAGDLADMPVDSLTWPLRHPPIVAPDPRLEAHFERQLLRYTGRLVRLFRTVVRSHKVRRAILRVVGPVIGRRRPAPSPESTPSGSGADPTSRSR